MLQKRWLVCRLSALLILRSVGILSTVFLSVYVRSVGRPTLAGNVSRLGEGGDFTTNVHTKHTLQIYDKLSYEELNRHFCQTAVSGWASLFFVC